MGRADLGLLVSAPDFFVTGEPAGLITAWRLSATGFLWVSGVGLGLAALDRAGPRRWAVLKASDVTCIH